MPVTLYSIVGPTGGDCEGPLPFDTSDFMRKSVYDKDNDGVVDKIKRLIDIEELSTGFELGKIPKVMDEEGSSTWAIDESDPMGDVDGGTF